MIPDLGILWPIGAAVGAALVYYANRGPEEGTTEYAKQQYADGEIDLNELERRIDVLEDPEATRIREAAERVSGIGEQTSWDIAAEFHYLDDVRDADREKLEEIPNVGEQRAKALAEEL